MARANRHLQPIGYLYSNFQFIPIRCQSWPNRPERAERGQKNRSGAEKEDGAAEFAKFFIPIYPNDLPTVPKPSRVSRTASLVFSNLPASQSAITRLLNRFRE
jgi:hypothetical protein